MFENLSTKLKSARISNNLTRKQAGDLVGVSSTMIGHYETGERMPSLTVLTKLASNYKVSIDYLLDNQTSSTDTLPLDGLTAKQIDVLKQTAECFRNLPTE
ncbi:MAG: helix-turn-helix transcriptional regulator [Roseburia sp.]|nr:helix-turn-helix transcriptional regulator [Roseburia sp.]